MYSYEILTDAAADVPSESIDRYSIRIIPMSYLLGDEEKICHGRETDEEKTAFYRAEREGASVKSTQINPERYREIFEPYAKEGKNVLYVCLSGGLSQTYASSVTAAQSLKEQYPDVSIVCIDSKSASVGMGLLTEIAAKNRENGLSLSDNAADLENKKLQICHWFTVDDLEFLKRGGRVPAGLAAIGKLLRIKPIMRIAEDGTLGSFAKKMGLKPALNELTNLYSTHTTGGENEEIRIVHCDCPQIADTVEQTLQSLNPSARIIKQQMSPIIGVHVGYDVICVVHLGKRSV